MKKYLSILALASLPFAAYTHENECRVPSFKKIKEEEYALHKKYQEEIKADLNGICKEFLPRMNSPEAIAEGNLNTLNNCDACIEVLKYLKMIALYENNIELNAYVNQYRDEFVTPNMPKKIILYDKLFKNNCMHACQDTSKAEVTESCPIETIQNTEIIAVANL
jgi:hypothetical protein